MQALELCQTNLMAVIIIHKNLSLLKQANINLVVLHCELNMQFMMIEELTKDFITVVMTVLINSA